MNIGRYLDRVDLDEDTLRRRRQLQRVRGELRVCVRALRKRKGAQASAPSVDS